MFVKIGDSIKFKGFLVLRSRWPGTKWVSGLRAKIGNQVGPEIGPRMTIGKQIGPEIGFSIDFQFLGYFSLISYIGTYSFSYFHSGTYFGTYLVSYFGPKARNLLSTRPPGSQF